jgi:hypothetical protein
MNAEFRRRENAELFIFNSKGDKDRRGFFFAKAKEKYMWFIECGTRRILNALNLQYNAK